MAKIEKHQVSAEALEYQDNDFTIEEVIAEARRCLNCRKPSCVQGCPIENDIPDFIAEVRNGNFGSARDIVYKKSNLPAVCGRVCPREKQCEGNCVLEKKGNPIQIGKIERFIADFDAQMKISRPRLLPKSRGKVAVIGSGPAGLTVAGDLAKEGFQIVVYEAETKAGGVLLFGIPEFRLSKDVVHRETKLIEELGVTFITNIMVGEKITVGDMFEQGFDAVFIGTGTALARELDIPGKESKGIVQSSFFLRMVTLWREQKVDRSEVTLREGERVIIIGSGNVAMDAARTAVRVGAASVAIVTRDTRENMCASELEYEDTLADGVEFIWGVNPIAYLVTDGRVAGLKVDSPEGIIEISGDRVMLAIGARPARRIVSTIDGIETDERGYLITKERPYGMTTLRGVFAGGDVVHQPATVVLAMKEAKKVAEGIASYVDAKKLLEL